MSDYDRREHESTRFDNLKAGDRIVWNGARDDEATVTEVLPNDGTVWVRWRDVQDGEEYTCPLGWPGHTPVELAEPYPETNPSGIHCPQCAATAPCEACQRQVDAEREYVQQRHQIGETYTVVCGETLERKGVERPEQFSTWDEAVTFATDGHVCSQSHAIKTHPIWSDDEPRRFVYLIDGEPKVGTIHDYARDRDHGDLVGVDVSTYVFIFAREPEEVDASAQRHDVETASTGYNDDDLATLTYTVLGESASVSVDGRA